MAVKPLLAVGAERNQITYPCMASAKIDGLRIMNWEGTPFTRSMKIVPNHFVRDRLTNASLSGMDGEVVVGEPNDPKIFSKTTGAIRSHGDEPDFTWWVFDERWAETDEREFIDRFQLLEKRFADGEFARFPWVRLLPHRWINDEEGLEAFELECAVEGYEGVMVRSPGGKYKNGRSTLREGILLKRKLWEFAECEVIECYELMINENEAFTSETGATKRSSNAEGLVPGNTLGGYIVRELGTGIVFSLGAGGTHEERKAIWEARHEEPGKIVRFKHFPYGRQDKPRQPIFDAYREKFDMDGDQF